jgi:hypothetical protein
MDSCRIGVWCIIAATAAVLLLPLSRALDAAARADEFDVSVA